MSKGERTRSEIIDKAIHLAGETGLESVSLGALASETGLSKSGLFAHFKSKEALQLGVIDEIGERFVAAVLTPAVAAPRGEARVRGFFNRYLDWIMNAPPSGGCIYMALSYEYDDRPGPVRDKLLSGHRELSETLGRIVQSGIDEGFLRADLDPQRFAFEVMGIEMACQYRRKFLQKSDAEAFARSAFEELLQRSRA